MSVCISQLLLRNKLSTPHPRLSLKYRQEGSCRCLDAIYHLFCWFSWSHRPALAQRERGLRKNASEYEEAEATGGPLGERLSQSARENYVWTYEERQRLERCTYEPRNTGGCQRRRQRGEAGRTLPGITVAPRFPTAREHASVHESRKEATMRASADGWANTVIHPDDGTSLGL